MAYRISPTCRDNLRHKCHWFQCGVDNNARPLRFQAHREIHKIEQYAKLHSLYPIQENKSMEKF